MDEATTGKMTPFDAAISQDSLQMLKATLPYMPTNLQKTLAVYAKISELSNTISYFRNFSPELKMMSSPQTMQPSEILTQLRQYTSGPMQNTIDQLLFFYNTMQMMQSLSDMPDLNQEVE